LWSAERQPRAYVMPKTQVTSQKHIRKRGKWGEREKGDGRLCGERRKEQVRAEREILREVGEAISHNPNSQIPCRTWFPDKAETGEDYTKGLCVFQMGIL